TLADRPLAELTQAELVALLQANLSRGAFNKLEKERSFADRPREDVLDLVLERVVQLQIEKSYSLTESLFNRAAIAQAAAAQYPDAQLQWRTWLTPQFLTTPMSSKPEYAGVRTALLGSLFLVGLTIALALPVGVMAAVYLQEYAAKNWFNSLIQTNIYNLSGVPSIVYGMLGLAVFVRTLGALTSGAVFGVTDTNGRTILSAALTLALLILPIIIVNAQEAIKAVPDSFRQAAYGLGATRWQTIWHHVLPSALPGILTGSILAVSRAIGETAPLVVVGASTFITADPDSPFAKFTALPIQIYNWTARPQAEFRNLAAAAILVLLVLLLTLNATAILLRNRFSRRVY
ncbi:MAG: phosphate ABC transporter permease PstA, partial [Anaerolineales bacterium]|nr:phosphate ABC transporter permease PstA [Anaerolineales bacterium]